MNRKISKECESTCEYVLPDYMGDIRKVMMKRAKATPTGHFSSDGVLEVSGIVEYEIIYADSENRLTAVNATSDYELRCPADSDKFMSASEESAVTSLSVRVTGPRKMTMKACVRSDVEISEETGMEILGDVFDGAREPESIKRVITALEGIGGGGKEREYAEEAERFPNVKSEDIEILTTSGTVRVTEAKSVEGGVSVKGEIIIVAIVRTPEQPAIAIRRVIPFEETVEIEGATADMQAIADGYVTSATCAVSNGEEECVLVVNAIAEYNATVYKNSEIEVIADAYLKEANTENKYCDFEYSSLVNCRVFDLPVNVKIPRSEIGCADAAEIIALAGEIKSATASLCDGGVNFAGEISISGVACENNVDGSKGYVPIKFQQAFEQNVNLNCQTDGNTQLDFSLSCVDCEGSLDAEDLYVKISLKCKMYLTSPDKICRLCESRVLGEVENAPSPSRITVYFPTREDTLFGVAKRFHTTAARIAEDNSISEGASLDLSSSESLLGVRKIIIR